MLVFSLKMVVAVTARHGSQYVHVTSRKGLKGSSAYCALETV